MKHLAVIQGGGMPSPQKQMGLALPENLTFDQWADIGRDIAGRTSSLMWEIGDWWAYGEHRYGQRQALVESDDWQGPSFQACMDAAYVARQFETSRRREVVSFSHHREVAALPADQADMLLDRVEAERWSRNRLREEKSRLLHAPARQEEPDLPDYAARSFVEADPVRPSPPTLDLQASPPSSPAGVTGAMASAPAPTPPAVPAPQLKWTQSQLDRKAEVEKGSAVVATMRNGPDGQRVDGALIQWAESRGLYVRIDRATIWGNPFEMPADGDRATVIKNYSRHYFPHKPSLEEKLFDLKGKVLGCWCHPEPCHGDFLCEIVNLLEEG